MRVLNLVDADTGVTTDDTGAWGFNDSKIVRQGGKLWTVSHLDNPDTTLSTFDRYTHHRYRLRSSADDGHTWTTEAEGIAGREPASLVALPDRVLLLTNPNGLPARWDSVTRTTTPLPGDWLNTYWPYLTAASDAAGTLYVAQLVTVGSGNIPSEIRLLKLSPDGTVCFRAFQIPTRHAYLFIRPGAAGDIAIVGTEDLTWEEAGFQHPTNPDGTPISANYVWKRISVIYLSSFNAAPVVTTLKTVSQQGNEWVNLLACDAIRVGDVLHVLWTSAGGGQYLNGRMEVALPAGTVTLDQQVDVPFVNQGRFVIVGTRLFVVSRNEDIVYAQEFGQPALTPLNIARADDTHARMVLFDAEAEAPDGIVRSASLMDTRWEVLTFELVALAPPPPPVTDRYQEGYDAGYGAGQANGRTAMRTAAVAAVQAIA